MRRRTAPAPPRTRWLSADGEFVFAPCADAVTHLRNLLGLYGRACEPLHFYPRSAWQQVLHGRSQALGAWLSTPERDFGEAVDPTAWRCAACSTPLSKHSPAPSSARCESSSKIDG